MFDFFKKIDLDFVADDWKDCYLTIREISMEEVEQFASIDEKTEPKEASRMIVDVLTDKFVEGFGMKDGVRTAFTKEDVKTFPPSILYALIGSLHEGLDKKKLKTSNTPSPESPEPTSPTS